MRLSLPLAVLTFLPAAAPSQVPFSPLFPLPVTQSTTLIDALSADANYTRLIALLQRSRLVPTLNRLNGSTLFAPTNDAIQRHSLWNTASVSDELYASLGDNIQEKLRQQLFYHLLNYSLTDLPLAQGTQVHKTLHFPRIPIEPPSKEPPPNPPWLPVPGGTLGGEPQRLRVAARDGATWVGTDYAGAGGIQIVRTPVDAGNGILLGIDGVLEPPSNLSHIISQHASLSYFRKILPSKLEKLLDNSSALTLFLPQDSAWNELHDVEKLYLESKFADDDVQLILDAHSVAKCDVQWSDTFKDSKELTTVHGNKLTIHVTADGTNVSSSALIQPDIYASNGVAHVVSSLLLPPGTLQLTPEKYLLALNCTTFVSLLRSVDLSTLVNSTNTSYTVLAPRDDVLSLLGDDKLPDPGSFELAQLLKYHFLPGHWTADQLRDRMLLPTALRVSSLNGGNQVLDIGVNGDGETRELTFGGAKVIGGKPLEINNTIIYLITRPLIPPVDALQTALPNLQYSTFLASVLSSSLANKIKRAPSVTLFIPQNSAFERLGLVTTHLLLPSSKKDLEKVIQHHAATEVAYLESLINGTQKSYATLEGSDLQIERSDNGSVFIEPSGGWEGLQGRVTSGNLLTHTGVIHEVSGVMLPRNLDITIDKLAQAATGGTMTSLATKAGMGWILNGTAPPAGSQWAKAGLTGSGWTLLCPTDDSFKGVNMSLLWDDVHAMRRIVSQHLIPAAPSGEIQDMSRLLAASTDPNRPIYFDGDATYSTLLSRNSAYGDIVFRLADMKNPQLGYLVGIKNARGTDGQDDWANVLSWGRSTMTDAGAGGVVKIDRLLVPYQPAWWVEYGPPATVAVGGVVLMAAFFWVMAYLWRRDTGEATYEPVGGFDREDDD
ncbi:FAS1 domain-containing protein [Ramaria rubella]|nr:FAS1 domain-containing protein [Ramaria rubella]